MALWDGRFSLYYMRFYLLPQHKLNIKCMVQSIKGNKYISSSNLYPDTVY